MEEYKRVFVFDLDGVVIDTRISNAEAFRYAFEKNGFPAPSAEDVIRLVGKPSDEMVNILLGQMNASASDEIRKSIVEDADRRHIEVLPKLGKPFAGIGELLRYLRDSGYRILACTSGLRDEQETALTSFGLYSYFDGMQTVSDTRLRKPDPMFLGELLQREKIDYKNAKIFYVDDSKTGIEMALNLSPSIYTIYAAYGYGKPARDIAHETVESVKSLRELIGSLHDR